jgi:hypothetical protein
VLYVALHQSEFVFSAPSLDAVLAFVADINEPQFGEDVAIWGGPRVVALCRSDGTVIRLDAPPAPPAPAPADLADAGEAVEDAA